MLEEMKEIRQLVLNVNNNVKEVYARLNVLAISVSKRQAKDTLVLSEIRKMIEILER